MQFLSVWLHYLPPYFAGTKVTLELTAAALVLSVAFGFLTALARMSRWRVLRSLAALYIELVRATPVLVLIFMAYYGLGAVGVLLPGFVAAVAALAFFYATLYAEIFRSGIESVPPGQREAAMALGLSERTTMFRVVLPQALLAMLPPATNMASDLLKDTSLVVTITVADLMYQSYNAIASTFAPMDMLILAAIFYFVIYYVISKLVGRWEYSFIQR